MLMNILYYFSILLQTIAMLCSIVTLARIALEKVSKKQIILSFLMMTIFSSITVHNINFPYNTILFVLIALICFKCIFKFPLQRSAFLSLILIILYFSVELLCVYIFTTVLNAPFEELFSSINIKVALGFMYSIILLLCSLIVSKFYKIKNQKQNPFLKEVTIKHLKLFLFIFIICILPQIVLFIFNRYDYPKYILIINFLQITIFSILLLRYIEREVEQEKTKNELILSELHNKTMMGMIDGVRILKHDYNNIIQALSGYIATKQYDKLETHINSVMKECNAINTLSAITTEVFNEPAIYGIVGSKYFIATEKDIIFKTDVTIDISKIKFPMPELSRILGILLDNAIEATTKSTNKYICLRMSYDSRKNADIIRIINTYDTNIKIDFEKIYSKGFSTKKVKSGIGLWEVKKLIDKNKNSQIYPSIEKDKFTQTIVIEN